MHSGKHIDYLDGLRGLAALYVTACHAYLSYAVPFAATPEVLLPATHWLAYGRSAVAVFIVLSGYCLMLPVARSGGTRIPGGTPRFFLRRARRLLPAYYGALALSLLLAPATRGAILSHLVLVHNYNPAWQHAIDYPMWSLATEWQIYFLFPVLVASWARGGVGRAVMLALRITLGLQVALILLAPGDNPWPPQFVALFALGMGGAAVNYPRVPAPTRQVPWGPMAAASFVAYPILEATVGPWLLANGRQQAPDLLVGGGTACLLIYCTGAIEAGARPWAVRRLESRPLVGVGRFSYSLYLVHAPVLAVVADTLRAHRASPLDTQLLTLGPGIAAALLASYLFYHACERPFLPHRPPLQSGHGGPT